MKRETENMRKLNSDRQEIERNREYQKQRMMMRRREVISKLRETEENRRKQRKLMKWQKMSPRVTTLCVIYLTGWRKMAGWWWQWWWWSWREERLTTTDDPTPLFWLGLRSLSMIPVALATSLLPESLLGCGDWSKRCIIFKCCWIWSAVTIAWQWLHSMMASSHLCWDGSERTKYKKSSKHIKHILNLVINTHVNSFNCVTLRWSYLVAPTLKDGIFFLSITGYDIK